MVAAALAAGQGVFKDWGDLLPGLRVQAGSHYVFWGASQKTDRKVR